MPNQPLNQNLQTPQDDPSLSNFRVRNRGGSEAVEPEVSASPETLTMRTVSVLSHGGGSRQAPRILRSPGAGASDLAVAPSADPTSQDQPGPASAATAEPSGTNANNESTTGDGGNQEARNANGELESR